MTTTVTATCRTDGCPSAGRAARATAAYDDPDTGQTTDVDAIVCGACGQPITEITEADAEAEAGGGGGDQTG